MKSVRIWFKKAGLAVYISHLDMNRCFSRAVIRARLPLWYTEGFNPKPYLNFLAPLPLGQVGLLEPLDIRIVGEITFEEIKDNLNAVMPQGIEIVNVTEPVMKTAEISAASYEIRVGFADALQAQKFAEVSSAAVTGGEILAEKRSKRGIKTVNLCEFIKSFEVKSEGDTAEINTVLACGSEKNLNPDLLLQSFYTLCGFEEETRSIARTSLLTADLKVFQ